MRACRVNEERNEIWREGAMPQTESWREREGKRDGDGKPERAQMRELR